MPNVEGQKLSFHDIRYEIKEKRRSPCCGESDKREILHGVR